ncbi:diguanylate cyclase domain-containing protein [Plantactinospora siamensis]|uniref:Diguanylate cyclase domain-containing protein n=1 Tax=Plantactinospora siamensis TaxID=555372 RepID=A0ABV6P628_9ACTN
MLLDHTPPPADATSGVASAPTAVDACRAAVTALTDRTAPGCPPYPPDRVSVLLSVHDRLRTVASTGSWQTFATVPPGSGISGRVWSSGQPAVVPVVADDPDYVALRPDIRSEICVPVHEPGGRRIGVLDLEWTGPVELAPWRGAAERVAALLGGRIAELGGPPAESRSEKLLRHVAAMTTATNEFQLRTATLAAARDVSGLGAAVLLLPHPSGHRPVADDAGGELAERILTILTAAGPDELDRLVERSHRFGAAYTLGEPDRPATADTEPLTGIGIGTLITVPVGQPEAGGVLLAADERVSRPDPTTVNLMELLAAQAWACLDRLRGLARLRERASSDPLTGLRHHGPFGERMAAATPGRTALLAIDVDGFKSVNDTYGHQAGDQLLIELARALEGALRQGDELYRIGGDEFVAVVEVARPEEAVGIGERLADAARRLDRTISVGVAVQRHREVPEHTMQRADAALYEVKRRGRDGVRLAPT